MPVTSARQETGSVPESRSVFAIPVILRLVFGAIGLALIGLLVCARMLEPDPSGIGTHRQLGFPPRGYQMVFGKPCPSCGMTTAWAWATRGNLFASAQANAGGFMLAVLALPAAV